MNEKGWAVNVSRSQEDRTTPYHITRKIHNVWSCARKEGPINKILFKINCELIYFNCWMKAKRIDTMEAALLPGEWTDFVSTNRVEHVWVYQNLASQSRINASQQPITSAIWLICLLTSLLFWKKRLAMALQTFSLSSHLQWRTGWTAVFRLAASRYVASSKAVRSTQLLKEKT